MKTRFWNILPIPNSLQKKYENDVDIVINGGYGGIEASTIVDCSEDDAFIVREGKGKLIW